MCILHEHVAERDCQTVVEAEEEEEERPPEGQGGWRRPSVGAVAAGAPMVVLWGWDGGGCHSGL